MAKPTYIFGLLLILRLAFPANCFAQARTENSATDSSILITGQVLDPSGDPLSGVTVSIEGELDVPAVSADDGSFTVSGLRGGVYQISTQGVVGNLRLWAPHTAPPVAEDEALVVHQAPVVYQAPPAAAAARGSKVWRIVTNPWVLGGVAAAAIIIPLSLDDHDDAS